MIGGIVKFLGGIIGLVQSIFTGRQRNKDREAGRNEEKLKGFQDAENTQKRIDAVKRPDNDNVIDSLHNGKF